MFASLLVLAFVLNGNAGFLNTSLAGADFVVPALTGPVVDQAGLLSADTERQLVNLLQSLHESGGPQIQVATLPDMGGLSVEEASIRLVDQWKLGGAKADNGVLLLVAAKERRVRIEVGQGLEGDLPDARASRIVQEVILPGFRAGQPDRALVNGVYAIIHYTDPKFLETAPRVGRSGGGRGGSGRPLGALELFILFIVGIFVLIKASLGRGFRGGRGSGIWWGGGGGGFGGGFGGSGGGSWGGGGGGFSGGGASGGW